MGISKKNLGKKKAQKWPLTHKPVAGQYTLPGQVLYLITAIHPVSLNSSPNCFLCKYAFQSMCVHVLENIQLFWNLCGTRGPSANCSRGSAGLRGLIGLGGSNSKKLGPGPQLWGRSNECLKPAIQRTMMCCAWFWIRALGNFIP